MGMDIGKVVGSALGTVGIEPSSIPLVGSLFGASPEEEAATAEMRRASQAYQDARAPMSVAQAEAMRRSLMALGGPSNQSMEGVYGPGMGIDFAAATQNPLTVELAAVGAPPAAPAGGGGGIPGLGGPVAGALGAAGGGLPGGGLGGS